MKLFILENCPHCRNARRWIKELQDENPEYNQIEIEFGRPLSPVEQETIRDWLTTDHYLPEVILLALREAVLNAAYSLKYMDRILLNWERRHLKTAQQVQAELKRHQEL